MNLLQKLENAYVYKNLVQPAAELQRELDKFGGPQRQAFDFYFRRYGGGYVVQVWIGGELRGYFDPPGRILPA
jgi:hypothetical protein